MNTRRRITEEKTKKLTVQGRVDAKTILEEKPEIVQVRDVTCLDKQTALQIAMETPSWPVVRGWAFCGDLFEYMINRAIEETAKMTGRDVDGVANPELFEEAIAICAHSLRRR